MSRFEAAQKAAAGPAKAAAPKATAAKAAAKAGTASTSASAKAKSKAPVLTTLEDKKKFVKMQEMKIDDAEQQFQDCTNKSERKDIEIKVKALKTDEHYVKAKAEIVEIEQQAKIEAERKALNAKAAASPKNSPKAKAAASPKHGPAGAPCSLLDSSAMEEIDAAFAASGKDGVAAKTTAVERMQALASVTPFVLPRVEQLIGLFDHSKLGAPATKAACVVVKSVRPTGHGIAHLVMPAILAGMDDKKWKVKAGCIEVLVPCLKQMEATPHQLAQCLPLIVQKLAEAALEVRAEIRTATSAVLREIGSLVASPEIKKLSQDLVTALAEPTNQKHTQAVLAKMGNQTFLSLIDAASLSLLMPVVVRGLKERDSASKKWSAQIFGSTSMLVKDIEIMKPFLKAVVPLLQAALTDPVQEVQRESAKAFAVLEKVLPEYSRQFLQPWLFKKLRGGEIGEQIGASLALAEVFLKMDKARAAELMPEIEAGVMEKKASVQRGFLELMDTMPHAMKMEFVPYIARLFPHMMMGINGDKEEKDEDAGLKASSAMVARFGDLCPDLLVPAFEVVFAATLHSSSPDDEVCKQVIRERATALLGKVVDKVLEHKKFGQDLLGTDDCSTKETRENLLVLVFLMRSDADAAVKRYANATWRAGGGSPKVQKIIMPAVEKELMKMRVGDLGLGAQQLAARITEELVKAGEISAPEDEPKAVAPFAFPPIAGLDPASEAATIARGESIGAKEEDASALFVRMASGAGGVALDLLESRDAFLELSQEVRKHCDEVARSVLLEGQKRKLGGREIAEELSKSLRVAIQVTGEANEAMEQELPDVAEAITRAALGDKFDKTDEAGDSSQEVLLSVESLLLMYGAGHLLLKDTELTMRKNRRYGVVGQNGAGKTTLMKEIVDHRIIGMPASLKCVHVDDSKLGLMSKSYLSAEEYCVKMAKEIGVNDAGGDTLLKFGFTEKMLGEQVAELSTGWRMRLTLAVSMLKHADLVLLDEPTNHLDEESVQWLGEYLNSITNSSVMVISHEPKFLNKVCTDIIAYVDQKLEYTEGDFTVFAAKKGLSKDQIDQMLSGNLSFNTKKQKKEGEEGEEGDDEEPAVQAIAGPPKLSFPIPGSVDGVKSGTKAVLEAKDIFFRWAIDKDYLLQSIGAKVSLNARVAICGRNGCGKSTLMTLLCSEMSVSENPDGKMGEVWRHCNVRMAYMKQDHLKALGPFFETSPFVYITSRFKDGFDGDLQKRLTEPEDEDAALRRKQLAKEMGKYGNLVEDLVSRTKVGSQLAYEVKWAGLDDPKQNTIEPISKLRAMGLDKVVIACDERIAAKAAGLDQRPLTRREVIRHVEAFGIDEEMCCNRQIRGFSAGQKVRLSLAAMFWTKPHVICVDEPTNYLDVETVEALAKALNNFRGGIVMIEPKTDFVMRICNEKWHLEDGKLTVEKLKNGAKRQA
jgi:ATPase subunit of ABC transporter with duplicated ATPase domains